MIRLSDKKAFSKAQLLDILGSLQELERLSRAVTRRGAKFEDYLEARNPKSGDLPKYIAKIREGNEEKFEFFKDDKEAAKFRDKMGIEDEEDEDDEKNGKEEAADKGKPKARIYEIYEAASLAKALQGLAKKGLDMEHYSAGQTALRTGGGGGRKVEPQPHADLFDRRDSHGREGGGEEGRADHPFQGVGRNGCQGAV